MKKREEKIKEYLFFSGIALTFILSILFYHQIKSAFVYVVSTTGFAGLFVLTLIMDVIIQPISPDILVFGSTFGGASLLWATVVGGLASCLAGIIDYFIGRRLGEDGFKDWFGEKHLKSGKKLFSKYGILAVVIGSLSPIPYSAVCWSAGVYQMRALPFMLTIFIVRLPRFFLMGLIGHLL